MTTKSLQIDCTMFEKAVLFCMAVSFFCLFCIPARAAGTEPTNEATDMLYLGDVDLDGSVTAGDARLALRRAVGLEKLTNEALFYADYDAGGSVTSADARMILRTSVSLEPLLYPADRDKAAPPVPDETETEQPPLEIIKEQWSASFSDAVDFDGLSADMYWLVDEIGVRSWWDGTQNRAAELLYDRLTDVGFAEEQLRTKEFTHGDRMGRNVMAVVPTAADAPDILLVMAHYDTARGTGGAVDNASGTAALLLLAKLFNAAEQDFGVELRFLFTAGEEQGYYGAYAYLDMLTQEEKDRHAFVFNLDMAGKPNDLYAPGQAYYLCVSTEPVPTHGYDAPAAEENAGSVALNETKALLGELGEDGWFSPVRAGKHDIVPFRKAGLAALTLSWRCISADESDGADNDLAVPFFAHTSADNMYYFDLTSLYHTTRLAAGAIGRLLLPYQQFDRADA